MRGKFLFGAASAALLAFGFAPSALAQSADPAGDASTQARLAPGTPVEGAVDQGGDTDWYRLHVESGQRYHFTLDGVTVGENTLDPMLFLYNAAGEQITMNDDGAESLNSVLDYAPSASGDVFIEARGFAEEAVGPYRLSVTAQTLPPDDAGNDKNTRARLGTQPVHGSLEYEGDIDAYRFSVRTGQRYTINMEAAAGGALDPLLRITDADGNVLAENDDNGENLNSRVEYVPTTSGTVFVEAHSFSDGTAGDYTLTATSERLPPENASADTSTRARLNIGQNTDGALDYAGDRDWFRIRLTEGQSYRFSLNATGDTQVDPVLRIYNARSEEVGMDDDGGDGLNSYLEYTAPATGTYYVEARAFDESSTGSYTLSAAAGDIPGDNTTDASISADGDYREGNLSPAGDHDWFRLPLSAGQGVRISLTSGEGGEALGDPMLVVYGPDGAELARDDDGGDGLNSWVEFTAPAEGNYFVEARGFDDGASGRYTLATTAGEIGNSAETAETLGADGRTGLIGADGDADWFAIDMVEGRPYRINVTTGEGEGLADPMVTLFDGEGHQVAQDDDGGTGANAYLSFTSAAGGRYYAAVSSYGDTGTGHYNITMSDMDVPGGDRTDETLDQSGDDRTSRVDIKDDVDFYRVELESGVSYTITVDGVGDNALADPFVAIVNGEGERVSSDDDSGPGLNARVNFRTDAAGTYYIAASGLGGSVGDYKVSIVRR